MVYWGVKISSSLGKYNLDFCPTHERWVLKTLTSVPQDDVDFFHEVPEVRQTEVDVADDLEEVGEQLEGQAEVPELRLGRQEATTCSHFPQ